MNYLKGDEKGEAATFLDRLFRALGHGGIQEAGATLEYRLKKDSGIGSAKGTAFADLMWKPRCLIEMKKTGTSLAKHYRQAFDYWIQAVPNRPRFVVLCNFDEFWVYDFDSQLDEPVERVELAELPAKWESLAFLLPSPVPPVFGNNLVEVTREAAAKVAAVFTRLHERGIDRLTAQQFTLQCVMGMFAEDIGLLPGHIFTKALDDALGSRAPGETAYELVFGLFREMNNSGVTPGGRYKGTPYFNGGLFKDVSPVELTTDELDALRAAANTNWAAVRPEIFGTLFEQSMAAGERHAYGAHFTSQADIARVVIPTVVTPWRERVAEARTRGRGGVGAMNRLLTDLASYKLLDPACGSGNFLYVAYRELRRIEHEVHEIIAELAPKTMDTGQIRMSSVHAGQFFGIDRDPFAVEIAKVTMMLAKKLAADELADYESVLPLENLDGNFQAADALFTPWPVVNAVIGNPPYLGRRKMVAELGAPYVARLKETFPNIGSVSDYVCYWFPLVHDHLPIGGRAGLVATKTVRETSSRAASLDYVVDNGGIIYEAVSSQPWSGDAVVHVSIVNWIKRPTDSQVPVPKILWLGGGDLRLELEHIPPSLSPNVDVRDAVSLRANREPKVCFQGQTPGVTEGYTLSPDEAAQLISDEPAAADVIFPFLGGEELLHEFGPLRYIIDIPHDDALEAEARVPRVMQHLRRHVLPKREEFVTREKRRNAEAAAANPAAKPVTAHTDFMRTWWQHWRRRPAMIQAIQMLDRYIALTITASWERPSVYEFVASDIRPAASLQVFAFDDDYSFGILHSALHRYWFEARCSRLKSDLRYTPVTVFDSFPWPQTPSKNLVKAVAEISKQILLLRAEHLNRGTNLSRQYNTLRRPGKSKLRELHRDLDDNVVRCYHFSSDQDMLTQLLALNKDLSTSQSAIRPPGGSGLSGTRVSSYRLMSEG